MTCIDAEEYAWDMTNVLTDEQATNIGNKLHQLDLLIEFVAHHQGKWDLVVEGYATSLVSPKGISEDVSGDVSDVSEWPFSIFPLATAVQDMYLPHTGMYAFCTFRTRNGTWTR